MNREELWSVAEIIGKLTERYRGQIAEHEAKMVEHRAAFGARTEADEKIIAGLRAERDGLLTQVQDMRVALAKEQELHAKTALRLSTEAAKLAQSKKGAWVKTTDGRVLSVRGYMVRLSPDREEFYDGSTCTPCDPPAADHDTPAGKAAAASVIRGDDRTTEPKPGDTVRMVRVPTPGPDFDGLIEFPWNTEWGSVGDVAAVVATLAPTDLPVAAVRVSSGIVVWWPLSCVEVVMSEFWVKVESERVVSACDVRKVTT